MSTPLDRIAAAVAVAQEALTGGRYAVSRLISLVEDVRPSAVLPRDAAIAALEDAARERGHRSSILGVTGTPGSGKSTLLAALAGLLTANDPALRLAIVAVDPSSPTSKGALLGDRTRMNVVGAPERVFFRSQASATALGGLAPSTFQVCRALALLFDVVLVETVGVGQSEADIRHLADRVYLVIAPLGGDELQYLKAGIIEVPDVFIINKCDEPASRSTYHQLRASLWLARPEAGDGLPIFRTSARTGAGLPQLAEAFITDARSHSSSVATKAPHFFDAWVIEEWGRAGKRQLQREGGAERFLAAHEGFGRAQLAFDAAIRRSLQG